MSNYYQKAFEDVWDELTEVYEIKNGVKLSKRAVAKKCGFDETALSKTKTNPYPSLTVVIQLADFFGVSCDRILGREPIKKSNTTRELIDKAVRKILVLLSRAMEKHPEILEVLRLIVSNPDVLNLVLQIMLLLCELVKSLRIA